MDRPGVPAFSAFGIGGTNAHVVLEASEIAQPSSASRRWQLLCVSAKTEGAVRKIASALGRSSR